MATLEQAQAQIGLGLRCSGAFPAKCETILRSAMLLKDSWNNCGNSDERGTAPALFAELAACAVPVQVFY
ncbi:hypothetical protein HED49_02965 [Ochrobactrum daejeonense]|nr:hypothetical protein [Brucella daejeonensis]